MPIFYPQINVQIGSNTAGTTANIQTGTMTLAGGSNITLSQNANGITFHGAAGGAGGNNTLGMSNLGNTSGTSGTISGSAVQMLFAGGNNVTLSQSINGSSATITISAGTGRDGVSLSSWPWPVIESNGAALVNATTGATGGSSQTSASYRMNIFEVPQDIVFNRVMCSWSISRPTTNQGSVTGGFVCGLYTLNGGTRFDSVSTFVANFLMSQSNAGGTAHTHKVYWGTDPSANSTQYDGNVSNSFYGVHYFLLSEGNNTLTRGNYYLMQMNSWRTANANIMSVASVAGMTRPNFSNIVGATNMASNIGAGIFSSTSNNTTADFPCVPDTINTNVFTNNATGHNLVPLIWFVNT